MTAHVLAILPNAGLANKLFVWARSKVFASLNGCDAYAIGWGYPKIGPWLRRERSLRMYGRYFHSSSLKLLPILAEKISRRRWCIEPSCERLMGFDRNTLYVFRKIPHWKDYFADIRAHRHLVKQCFEASIRSRYLRQLEVLETPVVCEFHVRLGDFRPLKSQEKFAQVGLVRTPSEYFLSIVSSLRAAAGYSVPITVFSDGRDEELRFLLDLPNVQRSPAPNDLLDLLLLSKSAVIVTSAGSTFSEWGGFLSEAAIIRHPDHIHAPIRPNPVPDQLFEGAPPETLPEWRGLWNSIVEPKLSDPAS